MGRENKYHHKYNMDELKVMTIEMLNRRGVELIQIAEIVLDLQKDYQPGLTIETCLGPSVVNGYQNGDILTVGQLNQRPQPVKVGGIELVEIKCVSILHPRPDFGGVVADPAVADLVADADERPQHQDVDAARGQGVDVGRLIEVGA